MAFRSTWSPNFDCIVRAGNQGIAFSAVTLSVWARLDNTSFDYETIEINNSNGTVFFTAAITVFSGSWAFHITNTAGTRVSYLGPAVSVNTWTHLALTFNGTTMVSYINGAQVDSRAGPAGPYGNWADIQVGPALGYLSDALFFTAACTPEEILQFCRWRKPKRVANLRHWLPCFNGAAQRLVDYSGNALNFTAGGTPADVTTTDPGVPWGDGGSKILLPPASSGTAISAAGSTVSTGSAQITKSVAITAAGVTSSTGAAAFATDLKASGLTQSTGGASVTRAQLISAAGLTQSTGAAGPTKSAVITASGLTLSSGTAQVSGSAPTGVSTEVKNWRRGLRRR